MNELIKASIVHLFKAYLFNAHLLKVHLLKREHLHLHQVLHPALGSALPLGLAEARRLTLEVPDCLS